MAEVFIVKVYAEGVEYGPFDTLEAAAAWAEHKYGPGWNSNWFIKQLHSPD